MLLLFLIIVYFIIIYNISRETLSLSLYFFNITLSNIKSLRPLLIYLPNPILSFNLAIIITLFLIPISLIKYFFILNLFNIKNLLFSAFFIITFNGIKGPLSFTFFIKTFNSIKKPLFLLINTPIPISRFNPFIIIIIYFILTPELYKFLDI